MGIFYNYASICWFGKDIQENHFISYQTYINLNYILLQALCSLSPSSTPATAREAQNFPDITDKSNEYMVKNLKGTTKSQ